MKKPILNIAILITNIYNQANYSLHHKSFFFYFDGCTGCEKKKTMSPIKTVVSFPIRTILFIDGANLKLYAGSRHISKN